MEFQMAPKKETNKDKPEITEAKIRQAMWMLKVGKTKKSICEHLGIAYNTKRLDKIIADFQAQELRLKELKEKAKTKVFSDAEKRTLAKDYQNGTSISAIAAQNYVSAQKVKAFIIEQGVPIRSRKKKGQAQTDHIVQDLDAKFRASDKVFYAPGNAFAYVEEVLDEDYIEYLGSGIQRYKELIPFTEASARRFPEPVQGIHYEIYWILEDSSTWKLESLKAHIKRVETHLEEYGRESYNIVIDGDYSHRKMFVPRHDLFSVLTR
jgi:hypothetical protein